MTKYVSREITHTEFRVVQLNLRKHKKYADNKENLVLCPVIFRQVLLVHLLHVLLCYIFWSLDFFY